MVWQLGLAGIFGLQLSFGAFAGVPPENKDLDRLIPHLLSKQAPRIEIRLPQGVGSAKDLLQRGIKLIQLQKYTDKEEKGFDFYQSCPDSMIIAVPRVRGYAMKQFVPKDADKYAIGKHTPKLYFKKKEFKKQKKF